MRIWALTACLTLTISACGEPERESGGIKSDPTGIDKSDTGGGQASDMGRADDGTPASDVGTTRDASTTGDAGTGADASTGTDTSSPGDLPSGETCPYTDLKEFVGQCDPVRLEGCAGAEACLPAVRVVGAQATVSASCGDPSNNTLAEGSDCEDTVERCSPGLLCIKFYQECRKLCYPDTSLGCDPGEFCRRPSVSWEGIGFCDSTCNL